MHDNFDAALAEVLAHEGGYVDHPKDPGGATNMGITRATLAAWRGRAVSKAEVKALTRAEASQIYKARYWDVVKGDNLPRGVDLVTFDPAVNSGTARGARWLQQALGVTADGKIGPATLAAANRADRVTTIKQACANRMGFLRGLGTWATFGRGWSRRVASIEARSVQMAGGAIAVEAADAKAKAQREDAAAGGAAAGGVGFTLVDLPAAAQWGLVALCAVAIIVLVARSRHDRNRAAAYAALVQEE
ncbi:MAG: glycoside hydrolase family 108 protein [Paracoccus sp. (in: a-proteobacteria)]|uniref:glycoside hydrolase family 108 protein n=1 Tax=Paracoccus sp. TaxID=267 RepID=UPI0026DFF456|nr:glycoside hydrolase family 108 protein [Paracoccus sp. (in: a-proteobacteria)]MDO5621197.1 glycoside hydrolase family 108 protein [Paracoccus sp. (in: a-proteobacteria)]